MGTKPMVTELKKEGQGVTEPTEGRARALGERMAWRRDLDRVMREGHSVVVVFIPQPEGGVKVPRGRGV